MRFGSAARVAATATGIIAVVYVLGVIVLNLVVNARLAQQNDSRLAGHPGAPGLCMVTTCRASTSQKKTGAESASPSAAPRNVRGARWLNTSGSWLAAARRSASRLSFCWVSREESTRLSTTTPMT